MHPGTSYVCNNLRYYSFGSMQGGRVGSCESWGVSYYALTGGKGGKRVIVIYASYGGLVLGSMREMGMDGGVG